MVSSPRGEHPFRAARLQHLDAILPCRPVLTSTRGSSGKSTGGGLNVKSESVPRRDHGYLNVLLLAPTGDLYGSTRSLVDLTSVLPPQEVVFTWLIPRDGPLRKLLVRRGTKCHISTSLSVAKESHKSVRELALLAYHLISSTAQVSRLIRKERIDVVHSVTATMLSGAYASALTGTPHLWHIHELVPDRGLLSRTLLSEIPETLRCRSVRFRESWPISLAKLLLRPGPSSANGFNPARTSHGRISPRLLGGVEIPTDAFVVGSASYLTPRKGLECLLEAYARLRHSIEAPTRLMLAGSPFAGDESYRAELENLARRPNEADTIFLGFVDDMAGFYAALDAFVAVSRDPEGFGLSVLEAMASSLPVVTANTGRTEELIKDGMTGFLVPPQAPTFWPPPPRSLRRPDPAPSPWEKGV